MLGPDNQLIVENIITHGFAAGADLLPRFIDKVPFLPRILRISERSSPFSFFRQRAGDPVRQQRHQYVAIAGTLKGKSRDSYI
jgi:hypothetical protein